MTTPKPKGDKGTKAGRAKREKPVRAGPIRSGLSDQAPPSAAQSGKSAPDAGPSSGFGYANNGDGVAPPHSPDDLVLNEAVAEAVKSSYDVLTETIEQGRLAAKNFRQGDYNYRQVPGDMETMGLRMLKLARQLSTTTFDLCEQMLREVTAAGGALAPKQTSGVPPFRQSGTTNAAPVSPDAPPSGAGAPHDTIPLTIQFKGKAKAIAHTTQIGRPTKPTSPEQISATRLSLRSGKTNAITDITFHADLTVGLVATITIPAGQSPGTYVGLIEARDQNIPLGILAVEITK
tara:strand:+ start:3167 stop:4036 length:870 start_codon:yes stop_codon:yes gene_type:complete